MDGQLQGNRQITRHQAFLLPLAGEGGAQRRMRAIPSYRHGNARRRSMEAGAPIRPSGTFPRKREKGAMDGQLQGNRQITRHQAFLLPLAGEGGAQRRMRATPSCRHGNARRRSVDARPHPPFGHLPAQAGEGSDGWSVARQPTDHAPPGFPSPAGGRRWRAAPDEGNTLLQAWQRAASECGRTPPSALRAPSPASGGRQRWRVSCRATDKSRATRLSFSRWREKVARSAG